MMRRGVLLGACALACAPATRGPADAPTAIAPAPADMSPAPGPEAPVPSTSPEPPGERPPDPAIELAADAGLRVLLDVRAWDVLGLSGRIVTVEPDFLHLRARDPDTGAVLWTTQVQPDENGWHTLFGLGDQLVLLAGPRRIHVDPATGKLLATRHGFFHGVDKGCRLDLAANNRSADWSTWIPATPATSVCSSECGCSLFVFDCGGAETGTSFHNATTHLYRSLREPHDTVCFDRPGVLARGRDHIVVYAQDDTHKPTILGLDAATFTRVWTRPELAKAVSSHHYSGVDPGGTTCWIGDDASLVGFACSTGATLWRTRFADDHASDPGKTDVDWQPGGLLSQHRDDRRVLVELRAADGKRRWQRKLPADNYAITEHARLDDHDARTSIARYVLLDPATGATISTLPISAKQTLKRTPDGYARTGPDDYAEFDVRGQPVRTLQQGSEAITRITKNHLIERTGERLRVLRRTTGAPVLTLPGAWSVRDSAALPDVLVLHEHRGESAPRVLVLRP